jgi:hypothetical protein
MVLLTIDIRNSKSLQAVCAQVADFQGFGIFSEKSKMDEKKPKEGATKPMVKVKFCCNVTNSKGLDTVLIQVKKEGTGKVIHEWLADIKKE